MSLEALHYVEGKHAWHVRIFRVLQSFRAKAAGASVAAPASLAYGAVRAAAESLNLQVFNRRRPRRLVPGLRNCIVRLASFFAVLNLIDVLSRGRGRPR